MWTRNQNDSGILRKNEFKEKKEELFVFGYSCKLFRDDEKALHIDQGKHLIPWMGDDALKIDRYDARGALHSLAPYEAPPGGYDWRVELTKTEKDVEQLCDEERFRALHTDEDEEEMYKEEELKRLHAAGYGQVGFNYDTGSTDKEQSLIPAEVDEPFIPPPRLVELLPPNIVLPEYQKLNAIIEKTANFIYSQGAQMEILLRAKQADNNQFQFLNKDSNLHPYYMALIGLARAGKWPEREPEVIEEPQHHQNEDYLHPSLASAVIESAPSIPSIHYRPSADCDYTMLISKIRGDVTLDEAYEPQLAPGELPPPGTEPATQRKPDISRAPVMYNQQGHNDAPLPQSGYHQQYADFPPAAPVPAVVPPPPATPTGSTGLSLMKNYNTDSDSYESDVDSNSSSDATAPSLPPEAVRTIIDKMASYVARNGDEFADIVRAKNDPRFTFLEPSDQYHGYYLRTMREKRDGDRQESRPKAPVSFSIKKLKEPEPVLPKPALPYESSSDEETDKPNNKQNTTTDNKQQDQLHAMINKAPTIMAPTSILYKVESQPKLVSNITEKPPVVLTNKVSEKVLESKIPNSESQKKYEEETVEQAINNGRNESPVMNREEISKKEEKEVKRRKEDRDESSKIGERDEIRKESKKERGSRSDKKKERRKSAEREKRKHRDGDEDEKKKKQKEKELVQNEIISLEDNSDDMIDLTGDQSDNKEGETETDRAKQLERRRRAAEFLMKVGVDPAHAALPTSSLASAMVDTLQSIRKRKQEEEERRRRKEKRRRREKERYENEDRSHRKSKKHKHDDNDSDYEGSKKKKRKKDKRSSKHKKKKSKHDVSDAEAAEDQPLDIDLSSTLKTLRNTSPTKELVLPDIDDNKCPSRTSPNSSSSEYSDDNESERKKKPPQKKKREKKDREYSEGEWSSDSDADSELSDG